MAISFYDASIGNYLQTLGAVSGFLDRGLAHCRENNMDPEAIVETQFYADMRPFRFQVVSVAHHSRDAIEGIRNGVFRPSGDRAPHNYAALQGLIADARAALEKVTPEDINGYADRDVVFELGESKRTFTAEGFLLSFSLPNLYFHATTAYDILRSKGVPIGKRDFMGKLRLKA